MEIPLKKDEHFSFSNDTNQLIIKENGARFILKTIFADKDFRQALFTREFTAQTIDVLLGNDITRKIMFEAIKEIQNTKDN